MAPHERGRVDSPCVGSGQPRASMVGVEEHLGPWPDVSPGCPSPSSGRSRRMDRRTRGPARGAVRHLDHSCVRRSTAPHRTHHPGARVHGQGDGGRHSADLGLRLPAASGQGKRGRTGADVAAACSLGRSGCLLRDTLVAVRTRRFNLRRTELLRSPDRCRRGAAYSWLPRRCPAQADGSDQRTRPRPPCTHGHDWNRDRGIHRCRRLVAGELRASPRGSRLAHGRGRIGVDSRALAPGRPRAEHRTGHGGLAHADLSPDRIPAADGGLASSHRGSLRSQGGSHGIRSCHRTGRLRPRHESRRLPNRNGPRGQHARGHARTRPPTAHRLCGPRRRQRRNGSRVSDSARRRVVPLRGNHERRATSVHRRPAPVLPHPQIA